MTLDEVRALHRRDVVAKIEADYGLCGDALILALAADVRLAKARARAARRQWRNLAKLIRATTEQRFGLLR